MTGLHLPRVVEVVVPVRTRNTSNGTQGHWRVGAAARAKVRDVVALALRSRPSMGLPVRVTMTRLSSQEMDDDGLRTALKPVRDEIAAWLPLPRAKRRGRIVADDRDPRVTWAYAQGKARRIGTKVIHEVVIRVEPWGPAHEAAEAVGMGS